MGWFSIIEKLTDSGMASVYFTVWASKLRVEWTLSTVTKKKKVSFLASIINYSPTGREAREGVRQENKN